MTGFLRRVLSPYRGLLILVILLKLVQSFLTSLTSLQKIVPSFEPSFGSNAFVKAFAPLKPSLTSSSLLR